MKSSKNIQRCIFLGIAFAVLIFLFPLVKVFFFHATIFELGEVTEQRSVAIVFGAGLKDTTTPSDALHNRLEVAARLYSEGVVSYLLVSGDNSTPEYSEPDVMFATLTEIYSVPQEVVFRDYAGRRTYDTCKRAHDLWGIDRAYLVSQEYHLPRAIWTCEKLGIDSVGVSATLQPYVLDTQYKLREIFAMYKAVLDIYFLHPDYIGGEFIQDLGGE